MNLANPCSASFFSCFDNAFRSNSMPPIYSRSARTLHRSTRHISAYSRSRPSRA